MRLAILNNERVAAAPGLSGACPVCNSPVIARCGTQRVHHWAHRGERVCDHWWEPETDWHRKWKLEFPDGCQEIILHDQAGEKHIADVRTAQGLTIEFQHSHLRPEERAAREAFYQRMIWVVDGRRLRRDLPRFQEGARSFRTAVAGRVFVHSFPNELFPKTWLDCTAPVVFDFGTDAPDGDPQAIIERSLWCLLPLRGRPHAIVLRMTRAEFIFAALNDPNLLVGQSIRDGVEQTLAAGQRRATNSARYIVLPKPYYPRSYRRVRRCL